ncbi:MAG: very short patch repair endonuclease [Oscillospiraceae bacterium]|nr:very short patch repair endonuclease [Oscillospiraceae bacterium]MCL2227907.1 very short patch repair endonuclease [Oscillospiraceae bacterium]
MRNYPSTTDPKRKFTMSRIKSKDTSIELSLRKALWRAGVRYRKNYSELPGSPDIAITKHKVVVFCDGEFWHGKDWEQKKSGIKSNRDYWVEKIERNIQRDNDVNRRLHYDGWTILRFWGKDIQGDVEGCVEEIRDAIFHCKIDALCTLQDTENLW